MHRTAPRYIDWLRNGVYCGLAACAAPWIAHRMITTPRARQGLGEKLRGPRADRFGSPAPDVGSPPRANQPADCVWMHGVSVGEVQLLHPLALRLRREQPDAPIVISTTTASGMELAQRLYPSNHLFYFPFDFSWSVAASLDALRPAMIVLGELELWPNLIAEANRRSIPIAVVNGRLSDRSYRGYRRIGRLSRGMFQGLSLVAAQTPAYAERFIACGCAERRVHVTGNTKFDNVAFDRTHPEVERLRRLAGIGTRHRIVMAGSTQDPEEAFAVQALQRCRQLSPEARLIVVPRHPDRFEQVHVQLTRSGLRVARRTELTAPTSADLWDILLVDTVGELRWWWGMAEIALVGGSFGQRGGQNMLEPAAYGSNVLLGPNTSNFRDVVDLLVAAQAVRVVPSLEALPEIIEQEFLHPAAGRSRGVRAREAIREHQGALERTAVLLRQLFAASAASQRQRRAISARAQQHE
ncbi:MAG: 3-deoxy-D-manno-octulosonic acid transferase [Planctomycetota bacterium]|nr:MAG: 3-deoxy-D-manno-octulosonic acid transferase [Planctomycetota bacterium]